MKYFMLMLVIMTGCTSCGVAEIKPQLRPLINPMALETEYFEALVGIPVTTTITFRNPTGYDYKHEVGNLAVCFTELNWVKVNPAALYTLSDKQRIILAAHEILHCQYGLDHIDNKLSVLNSYIPSDKVILKNWSTLMTEIKTLTRRQGMYLNPLPEIIQ